MVTSKRMSRSATRLFLLHLGLLLACLAGPGRAEETGSARRDVLVYKDGDRVSGRLVAEQDGVLVFKSDRFGELRVPASQAVVIKAETSPPAAPPPAAAAPAKPKAAERAEEERVSRWEWFSPAVLTAKLRDTFGPWNGRLALSTEVVSDATDRSTFSVEAHLKRKWKVDEVQVGGRFDYSETNDVATTDMIKADALWRHDFSKKGFFQYRPTLEWNRANYRSGVPGDYVLLQQEIGAGLSVLTTPSRKLRLGLSENLFALWNTSPPASNDWRTSESVFLEAELKLPWRMTLTDRTVYYYSLSTQNAGWENRIELNKKFTETLSTAIRHEIREGSPEGTTQDYTRLKLLFGLDF